MKKILSLTLLALACAWTTSAVAADGVYVAGNVGVAMATDTEMDDPELPGVSMDVTYDTGLALSAALGYGIGNFRLEAEFAWQRNDFDSLEASGYGLGLDVPLSGDVSVASGMVNGYFDFPVGGNWKPFITGGIGMAKVEVNDLNYPGSGEPDWSEFFAVIAGNGPCNAERLNARKKAWDDGAWFRDGLVAHAEKAEARRAMRVAAE